MPARKTKPTQFIINTTSLTLKKSRLDYELLRQHFRIYVYDLSESRIYSPAIRDAVRYRKMYSILRKQTIDADGSQYAFEFNKSRRRVYICLPPDKSAFPIEDFEGDSYQPNEFIPNLTDNSDIADLFRLACKTYCVTEEIDMSFVGQGPMYFPTGRVYDFTIEEKDTKTKSEGRPVLAVFPRHNWKRDSQFAQKNGGTPDTLEFIMPDILKQMYLVYDKTKIAKQLAWKSYYKLAKGGKAFVPLIPRDIDDLSSPTVYRVQGENRFSGKNKTTDNNNAVALQTADNEGALASKTRKKINFFEPTKADKLKQSRCHVLLTTYRNLCQYLTDIGLPTELTQINVKEQTAKQASLPLTDYPVTIINGLWQEDSNSKTRQDRFNAIVKRIKEILAKQKIQILVKDRDALKEPQPNERFLILTDYSKAAFKGGPLGLDDPYQEDFFYKKQGVVLKHLIINTNDKTFSAQDQNKDAEGQIPKEEYNDSPEEEDEEQTGMSKAKYLNYKIPTENELKTRLFVSFYKLHLLDLLCHPQTISARLPFLKGSAFTMLDLLEGVFFINKRKVLYVKDNTLFFQEWSDRSFKADLEQLTGRNSRDIFSQIEKYHTWNPQKLDKEKQDEIRNNSYVMVSRDFLLEISSGDNCRALFESDKALKRLEQRHKERFIDNFKVNDFSRVPSKWVETVNAWNEYIDKLSRKRDLEDMVSFEKLIKGSFETATQKYEEAKRKNPKTNKKPPKEDGNYGYDAYQKIGIGTSTSKKSQFNDILSNALNIDDIDLRSAINGMEYGKGIWFDESAMKYMVGGGQALQGTKAQPRSNLVRDIILFDGKFDPDKFFPLLNVDFVRHNGYPVLPFPFTILNDAIELQEKGWKFN
jgi:hypothetical protein